MTWMTRYQPVTPGTRKIQRSENIMSGERDRQQSKYSPKANLTRTQTLSKPTNSYSFSENTTSPNETLTTAVDTSGQNKKTTRHQNNGKSDNPRKKCDFKDIKQEELLISKFIESITDKKLRKKLIREKTLNLKTTVELITQKSNDRRHNNPLYHPHWQKAKK